jgi:hypothetical protein
MFQSQSFPGSWYQMPQPTSNIVTTSHNGVPSPTSSSHVEYGSTTSTIHVNEPHPVATSHAGGITLVATSHINVTSPNSVRHVGDDSLASSSHVESMSPTIVNDGGGIKNHICLRRKPKFLCRNCKGNHLTRLCPVTVGIPEAWDSPKGPLDSEASVVSPHLFSPLIDTKTLSMQSSPDHTPVVEGYVFPIHVIMQPIQPMVE